MQQHLSVGDVLPAMQLALLLATLSDDTAVLPGPLPEGADLATMEGLLTPNDLGYEPPELLLALPELTRMLNTSAAMIQCGRLGWQRAGRCCKGGWYLSCRPQLQWCRMHAADSQQHQPPLLALALCLQPSRMSWRRSRWWCRRGR